MSKNDNSFRGGGISLGVVVFIVFLILKLTGVIDWSWWWVVSPLLIELGLALVIILIVAIIAIVTILCCRTGSAVARGVKKRRRKHYDKE